MFLPVSQIKSVISTYGLLSLLILLTGVAPAKAHQVEVADDVGATLHIEPNDTPRAKEASQAWFALTHKGGKTIPIAECDCQLAVYTEPYVPGDTPILQPQLTVIAAERYQGIPGAVINFPRPGAYQLDLSGKPSSGQEFQPFKLKFNVTVAVGSNNNQSTQPNQPIVSTEKNTRNNFILPLTAMALVSIGAISFVIFPCIKKR